MASVAPSVLLMYPFRIRQIKETLDLPKAIFTQELIVNGASGKDSRAVNNYGKQRLAL